MDDDAALDGVGIGWARAVLWTPVAGTVALGALYVVARPSFYWLLREDHPVEWTQFTFLAFACLGAVLAAGRFARQGRWPLAALLALVALTCLVLAGEEISWGQRVFGWATPHTLATQNRQGETNFHNIDSGLPVAADTLADLVELGLGLGGMALGLLSRPARSTLHRTVAWQLAPPLFAVPGFSWMVAYQGFMLGTGTNASPAIVYQEWMELCFYASIAITVAAGHARAAAGRTVIDLAGWAGPVRRLDRTVPAGAAPLVAALAGVLVLTAVFAVMTSFTGIVPGNVPGAPVIGG